MKMIVVNGSPGSGKTSFAKCCASILKEKFPNCEILRTSVVEPIKKIARDLGWDGEKDAKGRQFLADIKDALDDYCGYTHQFINKTSKLPYDFIFIDARSDYDISYAELIHKAKSVYIERLIKEDNEFDNHADMKVKDYEYDYIIDNNGTWEDLYEAVNLFLYDFLGK